MQWRFSRFLSDESARILIHAKSGSPCAGPVAFSRMLMDENRIQARKNLCSARDTVEAAWRQTPITRDPPRRRALPAGRADTMTLLSA